MHPHTRLEASSPSIPEPDASCNKTSWGIGSWGESVWASWSAWSPWSASAAWPASAATGVPVGDALESASAASALTSSAGVPVGEAVLSAAASALAASTGVPVGDALESASAASALAASTGVPVGEAYFFRGIFSGENFSAKYYIYWVTLQSVRFKQELKFARIRMYMMLSCPTGLHTNVITTNYLLFVRRVDLSLITT
jgi:hypothetical protein